MSIADEREQAAKKGERVGLLLGYHKDMYKDAFDRPSLKEQCCAVYCARNSVTSWAFAISVCLMIIGTLTTLYGYFLPSIYLSWDLNVNSNLTMTTNNGGSRFEKEAKSLEDIYYERDVFVIVGLSILFIGGFIVSLALLLPLCVAGWNLERIPSPTHITVKNELDQAGRRRRGNCIETHIEEEF